MFTKRIRRASAWLLSLGLMAGGAAVASADGGKSGTHEGHKSMMQAKSKTISGRVVATKSVGLRGTNQRHLVALVRMPDGERKLVDLGPRADARKLDLSVGDQISARGREAKIKGQKIVIAERARTPTATLAIDRSMQRKHFDRTVRKAHAERCPPMLDDQG